MAERGIIPVARKEDEELFRDQDDPAETTLDVKPAPGRLSSSDVSPGAPLAPRAARFGEGPEGRGPRRERGLTGQREGFFERIATFWHDVRAELRRVSWPSAKQVQSTTIITIVAVAFFAIYLFAVDRALAFLITQLERLVNSILG